MEIRLYLLSGVPGSGKSFWAKNCIEADEDAIHLSRDELRKNLRVIFQRDAYYFPVDNKLEYRFWINYVANEILEAPFSNFIIDQTTLGNTQVIKFLKALREMLLTLCPHLDDITFNVTIYRFATPLEECIQRNSRREGFEKVPVDVIMNMANMKKPDHSLKYDKTIMPSVTYLDIIEVNGYDESEPEVIINGK